MTIGRTSERLGLPFTTTGDRPITKVLWPGQSFYRINCRNIITTLTVLPLNLLQLLVVSEACLLRNSAIVHIAYLLDTGGYEYMVLRYVHDFLRVEASQERSLTDCRRRL